MSCDIGRVGIELDPIVCFRPVLDIIMFHVDRPGEHLSVDSVIRFMLSTVFSPRFSIVIISFSGKK